MAGILTVLTALQCCHLNITNSGLSVALLILAHPVLGALQGCHLVSLLCFRQQLLVSLSPSLRPVLPVVLEVDSRTILEVEVDTYGESRGDSRGRHRAQSLDSTRLAPEAWLGIASYMHQVQTCLAWQTFCFLPLCWYQFHRSDQIFVWGCLREVAIRFPVQLALRIVIWVGFRSFKNWPYI